MISSPNFTTVSTLLFKDYMVNFTHFCQTCYQVYTYHINNFSGSRSMSNTMKNKLGKLLQELFSRSVDCTHQFPYNVEILRARGFKRS